MQINGSSILVTGGCGLVGSTTIDLLLRDYSPSRIVILDNLNRGSLRNVEKALQDPHVTLVHGDVRDADLVRRLSEGMDAVIHMATLRITACAAKPREALGVMCDGAFNVAEAAQAAGVKKVGRRLVSVNLRSRRQVSHMLRTITPYNNRTWYGACKTMLEWHAADHSNDMYGLPYLALRYFNVYGPRMDIYGAYTEVLIRWMERIVAGKPPLIFGDGTQTMDVVYIEDIARANILAAKSAISDEVFNVASGTETSLNVLALTLARVMGSNLRPEYGPERKVNPVPRRLASTEKAHRLLGFETSVNLEEGLRRLVAWWRAQQAQQEVADCAK